MLVLHQKLIFDSPKLLHYLEVEINNDLYK